MSEEQKKKYECGSRGKKSEEKEECCGEAMKEKSGGESC